MLNVQCTSSKEVTLLIFLVLMLSSGLDWA